MGEYLNQIPEASEYLNQPIYFLSEIAARRNIIVSETPHTIINQYGYSNSNLPFLRSVFVRDCFNDNTVAHLSFPIGIMKGAVVDETNESYRTIELYIYATNDSLEEAMEKDGFIFPKYFKK